MGAHCCQRNSCPTHPDKTLAYVCILQECLEPLCSQCVDKHRQVHKVLGYGPKLQSYTKLLHDYEAVKQRRQQGGSEDSEQDKAMQQLCVLYELKQMTREYFRNKSPKCGSENQLLHNLELSNYLNKGDFSKKFKDFLKQELVLNQAAINPKFTCLF